MSKDLSTQLPNPPELQPITSASAKIWQVVSSALMIGGIILIGAGGWIFVQQQIEASKPPPARILEVSVEDLVTEPPVIQATPTQARPTATENKVNAPITVTVVSQVSDTLPVITPTMTLSPVNTSTLTPTAITTVEPAPELTAEPTTTPTHTPAPTATPLPIPTEEAPSLADNPLVMVPEETPPAADSAAPNSPSPSEASPLSRIVAESIGLDTSVIEVGWQQVVQNGVTINAWVVADYAAGWHKNSALPGQGGNIVISGHHNINGEVFRYIVDLEPGATVSLYDTAGQIHNYVIVDKFIVKDKGEPEAVRRENAKWIGVFNEERLTLITCWPYTTNTHRVVVIGKPAGSIQTTGQ
jgi:sortase A